jgi:Ca2+-binding EF-hand superfamily protein
VTLLDSQDFASRWLQIADVDGNGTIDFEEFKNFLSKLSATSSMDEQSLQEVFSSIDTNGNGQLNEEEFGNAIYKALAPSEE